MRTYCALVLAASFMGCYAPESYSTAGKDLTGSTPDLAGTDLLSMSTAPCVAAQGLPGTNLFCADFNKFTTVEDLRLANWGVSKVTTGNKECWELVANGDMPKAIQIINFRQFQDICSFTIPAINKEAFDKYNSFTLSVVQTLAIDRKQQAASIFLFQAAPERQIWSNAGVNPRQVSTITTTKNDILTISPNYQPVFHLQSSSPNTNLAGWQIESIAINGQ